MHRMPGLDLLRAIAILAVLGTHAWVAGGMGPGFGWLLDYGWMGVDLFFVLSGYLIGRQVLTRVARGEPMDLVGFYRQRAFRILPAYFVMLALYLCIPGFRETPAMQPAWQYFTFTVNLFVEPGVQHAFSSVWSLCVEEHFYLLFPLVILALAPIANARRIVGLMVATVVVSMAWRAYAWHAWPGSPATADRPAEMDGWRFMQFVYYPTYARLDGLLAGIGLALLCVYRPQVWARIRQQANGVAVVGAILIGVAVWMSQDTVSWMASVPAFTILASGLALVVASATSPTSVLARVRVPGAAWVATVSYSLYLIHKAIFRLVYTHLPEGLAHRGLLTFLMCAACAIAAAAVLHYAVERPFLRLRSRTASYKTLASATGSA